MIPFLAASVLSCASAETPSTSSGTGGKSVGTGGTTVSSGGAQGFGSGGSSSQGTGGSFTSSSGGAQGFGSGGSSSPGTGGSIITGGGTGGAPVTGGALTVVDGYAKSATWMGYAYTFVGPMTGSKATVTPASFMAMTTLCAMGTIAADPAYASVAGVGWNINQAVGTTATPPPILPTASSGAGLSINVTATGLTLAAGTSSQLRAQVKTAAGDFCAPIGASGSSNIPWASFNKTCWDTTLPTAMVFAGGTPITAVELIIPSGTAPVGPFTLCLMDAHTY